MSYGCTELHQADDMIGVVRVRAAPVGSSSRFPSGTVMLQLVFLLFICTLPGIHSMSIVHPSSEKHFNDTTQRLSLPKDTPNSKQTDGHSEGIIRSTHDTLMDSPSVGDTQEWLDYRALLKRSQAEATAGCSNMSGAEVLKRHVEKLRNTANGQVDLVFLVDSSSSVGITDFFNELKFIRKMLAGFEVAEWATRVAVITFSSLHRVVVNIDHLSEPSLTKHKCSLLNSELPSITYVGGGTFTRGAFVLAKQVLTSPSARPNATKAVFLITDGYSNGGDPRPIAQNLIRNNVEIFTFGIRDGYVKELLDMASEPKLQHCYILDSFQEFEALARRALHEDLHLGEFILENAALCSSLCPQGGHCCHPAASCRCGTTTGQYECICPPGYHGSGFVDGCHACPAGTYKPQSIPGGISTCKPCPDPNHTSRLGSTSVADCRCRSGYQAVAGEPACEMIKCPPLSPPTNGFFVSGECSNTINSACALRCSPGYELIGRAIRVCLEDGTWSGEPAVCRVKKCHSLQQVSSGTIHCTKEDFAFDTECTTLCNRGYVLVGSKKRRCLPIALWDGLPSACRAVTCPPLEPIAHATLQPETCSSDRQIYGTECVSVCNPGYQLKNEGENARRCLASGMWSPKPEQPNYCIDVTTPDILCPHDITVDAVPNDNVANVSWTEPLTVDNSGDVPVVTVTPAVRSPWLFPIGDTFITYFATDKAGNSASCSFVITVVDSQPPVIERCRSPGVVLATDNQSPQVTWEEPRFSDNSGRPVAVSRSHAPGLSMSWGTTNVEYIARDETGNTKSCHITVNVQQSACIMPDDPRRGQADCLSSNEGIECSLRCDEGYAFPIEPEPVYRCSEDGRWSPSHAIPWEDCSKKENPDNATQPVKFTFPVDYCDQDLANQMAENIRRSHENQVGNMCSGPVDCRFAGVRVNCQLQGTTDILASIADLSSQRQRQQQRGDISFRQEQFEKLRQFPSVYVDMNVTGKLNLPEGVTSVDDTAYQELRSALASASNAVVQSVIEEENIPPGMGSAVDVNSVIMLPSEALPICRPGNVVDVNQCLQCAVGTFFNKATEKCERCPQGSYQDQPGQLECQTCPPGSSTASTRAQSLQECKVICSPGSYSDTGLEQCEACPKGSYQPHPGSTECVPCPAGTLTLRTGATMAAECAEPCSPGYVSRSGLVPCLPCPDGYYQPGLNKTLCYKCPQTTLTNSAVTTWEDCIGTNLDGFNISALEVLPYNDCFSSPCAHGGTCQAVSVGFVCVCQPGYTGITCDSEINECDSFPCQNSATCQDDLNDFMCVCPQGFEGKTCSVDIDDCSPNSCQNSGTCIDGIASYQCICSKGYSGDSCELEVNECLSLPCYNNARCVDGIANFTCDCAAGFYGTFCEMEEDECQSSPCLNGGTCHDLIAGYRCDCEQGFAGIRCEINVDECISSPCQHGGSCVDGVNGYRCICQHGYTGQMCEVELPWDFSLQFEHLSTTDYILKRNSLPDLHEVTAAFWMRTTDTFSYGTPFSYAAVTSDSTALSNAFTFMDYSGFVLYVSDSSHVSDVMANDGLWHHIAITWSSQGGEWVIYKDGQVADSGEGLAEGVVIPGGGVFVVGQEQDSIGGDFASSEAFIGEITLLHMWGRVLNSSEIVGVLQDCQKPVMDDIVLAWPDMLLDMYGEIKQLKNNFCKGCYAPLRPDFGDYTGYQTDTPLNMITYSCEVGFEVNDNTYGQATCQISGEWIPYDPPVCQRKKCGFPGHLPNGETIGDIFYYEHQVQYVCLDGFTLIGPATRVCLETGLWSDFQPRCEVVVCGAVPEIPNAYIQNPLTASLATSETSVIYHCQEGYRLQGHGTITCGSDGEWSQLPECLPIVCSRPERNSYSTFTSSQGYVLGARVTYNCYAGYQLVGNTTRTCQPDASWLGASPRCVPLQCGPPPNITFATFSSTGLVLGSIARYSCSEGYQMYGNGSLACAYNLKWVGEFLECLPVPCPDIRPISHGGVVGDLFHYGKSVVFLCDAGYQLEGPTSLSCLATGVWNDSVPVCRPISCGLPETIPNGHYEGENFQFQDVVRYHCQTGFVMIGQAIRSCEADGQWNGTAPHCEIVTCKAPPVIPNADIAPSIKHEVSHYHTNVTFQCHTGFILRASSGTLMCGLDGSWQGETNICEAVTCKRLGGLANGRLIRTGHNFNDTATYICHEGFDLSGDSVRVCQADGQWSGVASGCLPISCPKLPEVPHAKLSIKSPNVSTVAETSYRTKVRYRCDSGYQLDGDQELRCTVSGDWSSPPPSCQPIRCPDLPSLPHGTIHGNDFTYNKSVVYTCDTGYHILGKSTSACLADGTWSEDVPVCKMVICGEPARLDNGRYTGHNFLYQGVVTYSCNQGYILNGAATTKCLASGQWSSVPPLCQPVDCGPPPAIANTTYTSNSTLFGSLAYYACQEGYIADGDVTVRCGWDGNWMGASLITCSPMRCSDPPSMEYGFVKDVDYYVGDTAEYSCIEGTVLHGEGHMTCLPNRTWTPSTSYCRLITCPELQAPIHGTVHSQQRTYASLASYTCDEGYLISGIANIACMENGTWSHHPPVCEPVSCPVPSLENGIAQFVGHRYLDVVSYQCDEGYRLVGEAEQHCLANTSWSAQTPVCEIVSCGVPALIDSGKVEQREVLFGETATYSCTEGYQLQGQSTRSCLGSGVLSGEEPTCQIISCPELPLIKNAVPSSTNSTYGSLVSYHCIEGFYTVDHAVLECLANGSWSQNFVDCLPISCGHPDEIQHGRFSLNDGLTTYGSKADYHCHEGYIMQGNAAVVCHSNGSWDKMKPICEPVSCGPPPNIQNGDVTTTLQTYLSRALYTCQTGYLLVGPDSKTCLSNGSWSDTKVHCKPVSCDQPEPITNGHWVAHGFVFGDSLSYVCDLGHELMGTTLLRTCEESGQWSGSPPICQPIKCPPPKEVLNGVVLAQGTLQYQTEIQYRCDKGYVPSTSKLTRVCQADRTWSGRDLVCIPISCGPPPLVENTYVPVSPALTFNTTVVYRCHSGYQLQGTLTVTCLVDGLWSIPRFQCDPVSCGNPQEIVNGRVHFSATTYNSIAVYTCDEGYTIHGTGTTRCLADRLWSALPPVCKPVLCGLPPSLPNAVLLTSDSPLTVEDFVFATVAQYMCIEGYKMASSDRIACQSNGTWNSTNLFCQIRECPPPLLIDNGRALGETYTFRSTVQYMCDPGYEVLGSSNLTCLANETWHPSPPNCTRISCPEIITPPHTTFSGVGRHYQDVLTFRCQNELQLRGAKQLRCTADGTWDNPVPSCAPRSCGRPPDLDFGIVFGHSYQPGDTISYRCRSGYLLDGPSSRKCLPDYRWSGRDPKCVTLDLSSALNQTPVCIFPCLHGGTCTAPYQCSCPYGFAGSRCEIELCTSRCIGNARCSERHPACKHLP